MWRHSGLRKAFPEEEDGLGSSEDEVELPADSTDLYAVLNLPRDASDDDVQRAYRTLARTFHPDKHQDDNLKQDASESFARLNEAYSILSDPQTRQIYDIYGMEGIKSGLEVSQNVSSQEDLKTQWNKFKKEQRKQQMEQSVNYNGVCILNINAEDLVHGDPPRVTSGNMMSNVEAPLTSKDTLTFGGQLLTKTGVGGGGCFVMGYHRDFSAHSSLDVTAEAGLRQVLQLTSTRQLSEHSWASVSASWSPRAGAGLEVSTRRQLTERLLGELGWVVGPPGAEGMTLTLRRQGATTNLTGSLLVGSQTGVTCSAVRKVTDNAAVRAGVKLGTMALEAEIGGSRRVGDFGSVGVAVAVGIQGVIVKLRVTRGGQRFVVPCVVYSHFDWRVALASWVLPPVGFYLTRRYLVRPAVRWHRKREARSKLARNTQLLQQGLAKAAAERRLLSPVARRKARKEAEEGGLVIVSAVYGEKAAIDSLPILAPAGDDALGAVTVPPSGAPPQGDQQRPADALGVGAAASAVAGDPAKQWLDVTEPVQFLVESSRLALHDGITKAGLMGFCDVSPGEEKELRVVYLLGGQPCLAAVDDGQSCRLPEGGGPIASREDARAVLQHAESQGMLPARR